MNTTNPTGRRWPLLAASTLAVLVAGALALDNVRLRSTLQDQQARAAETVPATVAPAVVAAPPAPEPRETRGRRESSAEDAQRIAELEKQLRERDASLADMRASLAARQDSPRTERGERGNFNPQTWMEDLRTRDPQRFEEMQQRFNEMAQRTTSYLGRQDEFLKAINTNDMTPEQRDNHEKLLAAVARARELNDQLAADPDNPQAGELRSQLFQVMRESRELLDNERQIALQDMATQMGYSKEQAPQFVEYINHVFEMTNPGTMFRGMMGGWGGRGGGGSGGGGGAGGGR